MSRIACRVLLTAIIATSIFGSAAAQEKPAYKSLLWEISGNGLTKPSYLYGTMHVSNKVAFHLTDTFFMGLKSCDIVALEMNPDTWMDDMVRSEIVGDAAAMYRDFNFFGNNGFYRKATELGIPESKTIAQVLAVEPRLVNGLLYRFNDRAANFQEDTYLDLFIYQAGKKFGKRVSQLEGFDESMELAQKAMLPDENPEPPSMSRYKLLEATGKNIYELIEDAYRKGDLDLLDSLSRLSHNSKNYQKYLIDERNYIMIHNLDSMLRRNTVFAAVGAAHLPGTEGMINLLRKKGYTVRAVTGPVTKKSKQTMNKVEEIKVPMQFSTQYAPDSSFRVDLPGKLYEMPSFGEYKEYLYPDMVNGAYYTVSRIRTYGPLIDKDPAYIVKSIDSLLYEFIPGNIIKRKAIEGAQPGFDITSKTKRGDVLRYKIMVTPMEIFIFKMGGTGEFAKSPEGEKFFNSIQLITSAAAGWKKHKPSGSGYEVQLPGIPLIDEAKKSYKGEGQHERLQALDKTDGNYYLVMRSSLHDFSYIEEDTFELGQLAEQFNDQLKYEVAERKLTTFNGYPAIDVKLKKDRSYIFVRSIIRGPYYYVLAGKTKTDRRPDTFFDSFRFTETEYPKAFETYNDTTLHFTVTTAVQPKSKSTLDSESLNYLFNKMLEKELNKEKDQSYMPKKQKKTCYSVATSEAIHVKYEQFHKFYSPSSKEKFWDDQAKKLAGQKEYSFAPSNYSYSDLYYGGNDDDADNPLVIKEKKITEKNGLPEMHLLLTDTNSTRAIKAKLVLKGGVLYTLLANIDTLSGESKWVKTFFETFAPADTTIGEPLFSDKANLLLTYLNGSDSTLKKQAVNSIYEPNFEDKHAAELLRYVKSPAFKTNELHARIALINTLGYLKHPEIIPFLEKTYKESSDTVSLQFAILGALASQKSDKAISTFMALLNHETPLTSEEYEISYVFNRLDDSLALAKKMYPALLQFAKYREYESNVYDLLAMLVDSNIVDKSFYAANKPQMLKEANEELRRQFASEENTSNPDGDYYDYDDYYGSGYSYGNYKLNYYSTLLLPYYSEPPVKAYFDKISKSKNDMLKLSTSMMMLRKNIPVADSTWKGFASRDAQRLDLYDLLKEAKRLDKFDPKYKTQLDFTRSLLYANFDAKEDSVQFLEKRLVTMRNGKGYVYFYKSKRKSEDNWHLDYSGLQPEDQEKVSTTQPVHRNGQAFRNEQEMKEEIDSVVKDLAMRGRKRVGSTNKFGLNFGDMFGE